MRSPGYVRWSNRLRIFIVLFTLLVITTGFIGVKQGLIFSNKMGYLLYSNSVFPKALSYKFTGHAEFVITKPGMIYSIVDEKKSSFQDLTNRVYDNGTEYGLLSIEFHQDLEVNHYVYLFFTEVNQSSSQQNGTVLQSTLSRFTIKEDER